MAEENWSTAAQSAAEPPTFRPELVEEIYKRELGGGSASPQKLKRVMMLEISQYLENYLWPYFDADTASTAHVMSILVSLVCGNASALGTFAGHYRIHHALVACTERVHECQHMLVPSLHAQAMVNEKFRENVPAWNSFEQQREKFPAFFARVLGLLGMEDALQHMHERVTYLLFIIHAFQSLEQEAVRVQVLKLVSLPLWHALSRGRLQVSLASRAACCPACRWLSGLHSSKATLPWQKTSLELRCAELSLHKASVC